MVAPKNDPALSSKEIKFTAALSQRLLLLEEGHCLRQHTLQACNRKEIASQPGLEATSLLTLVQMVESGLGVALLPAMAIKSGLLRGTKLASRALAAGAPARTIALVTRETSPHLVEFEALAGLIPH